MADINEADSFVEIPPGFSRPTHEDGVET